MGGRKGLIYLLGEPGGKEEEGFVLVVPRCAQRAQHIEHAIVDF